MKDRTIVSGLYFFGGPVKKSNPAIVVASALAIAAFSFLVFRTHHAITAKTKEPSLHTEEIEVAEAPAGSPALNVLFVGNSYIFVNDLPGVVANIAATDSANPVKLRAGRFVGPGSPLAERWQARAQADPLAAGKWDYVVLQESPIYDVTPLYIPISVQATMNWDKAIKQNGAKTLIFGPWARKEGSDDYRAKDLVRFKNPDEMQAEIDRVRKGIAARVAATFVPVGDYWMACRSQPGAPELYNADATHPSAAGTYLTALVFYRQLTGHDLKHVTYIPPRLSKKDAAFILRCASY